MQDLLLAVFPMQIVPHGMKAVIFWGKVSWCGLALDTFSRAMCGENASMYMLS